MAWRRYIGGAAVQAAITLALAAQAFLAPRILGASEYGRSVAVLAMPILVQAAIETVLFALTIKWTSALRLADMRLLWMDALVIAPIAGFAALLLGIRVVIGLSQAEIWAFIAGTPLLVFIWIVLTILMACCYALHRHVTIARTYLLSAMVLPASIFLMRSFGARAFLFGLLADKILASASLWLDAPVRALWRRAIFAKASGRSPGRLVASYLPVLTPRLTVLMLSPGLVAIGAWLLVPEELAGFKVSLSFVTGAASLVPVSQHVLQASWTNSGAGARSGILREARLVLLGALLIGIALAAALLAYGDALRAIVLRTTNPSLSRFDVIFLAVPLFVLIGPMSSFLVATERTHRLVGAFVVCVLVSATAAAWKGPGWGFVGGTVSFVLFACVPLFPSLYR